MNCQELARILEEQDLHLLPAGERGVAQAHLAACPTCARDHELQLRLAALPIAPLQSQTVTEWRALAADRARAAGSQRVRGRMFLAGSLALAAAAAALVLGLKQRPEHAVADLPAQASPADQAPPPAVPVEEDAVEMGMSAPTESVKSGADAAAPVSAGTASFTVLVQPLQYETQDPMVQFAVQDFFAALLEGLRAIPGLVLVGPDPSIDTTTPGDFRISVTARPGGRPGYAGGRAQWEVMLRLATLRGVRQVQPIAVGGMFGQDCGAMASPERAGTPTCGPARIAESIIHSILMPRFPIDPAAQQRLQARLLDGTQPVVERSKAMMSLRQLRNRPGATADAAFLRPLAAMAQLEPDDTLRLEAVTLLATDFGTHADARVALEQIAHSDRNRLVRKVAERAIAGSVPWRSYAVAIARDTSLPAQQRLAPLEWMVAAGQRTDLTAVAGELLDGGADLLVDLLSGMGTAADATMSRSGVLFALQGMRHPAAADLWLASFDRVPEYSLLYALRSYLDDPRVRRKFEEVAADEQDSRLGRLAAASLNESAPGQ